jgi:hypothetical protein
VAKSAEYAIGIASIVLALTAGYFLMKRSRSYDGKE